MNRSTGQVLSKGVLREVLSRLVNETRNVSTPVSTKNSSHFNISEVDSSSAEVYDYYSRNDSYDYDDEIICLEWGTGGAEHWARESVTLVLALLILLSNSFIVAAVLRQWAREGRPLGSRAAACFLVLNLAVADALIGLFQILQWFHSSVCAFYLFLSVNEFTCLLPIVLVEFFDCASTLTVIVIALDRVLSVTQAVRYRNLLSPRRTVFVIACVWGLALFISLTVFMIPGAYTTQIEGAWMYCEMVDLYEQLLFWATIVTVLSVLIGCYWTIHRITLQMLRRGQSGSQRNLVGTKAARMLLIIISWDTCTYLPLLVVTLLSAGGIKASLFVDCMVRNFTLLTFLADPYIYAYGNPHTKKALLDLVMCIRGRAPADFDTPGNRESLAESSVNKIRRKLSSLTGSTITSDGDKTSPKSRRQSLQLT